VSNVTLPPAGTGTNQPVISTELIGGVNIQTVKLLDGTVGSTTPIPGGTNGLLVYSTATLPPSNATVASVASSASSVTLQAANANRKAWFCFNNSTQVLYVLMGNVASPSNFTVKLVSGGYYELPSPPYLGILTGIWASANGAALVTEL
jgi:hypothetical protein